MLTPKTQAEIIDQAREDAQSGNFTEYSGDKLSDIVWGPLNMLTGDRSSGEIAAEKQELYNKVRTKI